MDDAPGDSSVNTPATIRAAYDLPASGGLGAVAIVDAYHYATSLNDFNRFSSSYGLPEEQSNNPTKGSNKVFQVVYAMGRMPMSGGSYISSWNLEEALDIEWAHAMAPSAKIYLVEAASASMNDLMRAVQVASRLPGVHQVSMSWGGDETPYESGEDRSFVIPGVTFFASGGDAADEMEYPSASPNVVSVGGTTLECNEAGEVTSETAWSEAGCGISQYEGRPTFQSAIATEVGRHRGSNDVAFDADPNTGVAVYDSTALYGEAGWWVVGGTSVGSPSWAGLVNLASKENGVAPGAQAEDARLYSHLGDATIFKDVTTGEDGAVTGTPGWDQPTGLGSPQGIAGK